MQQMCVMAAAAPSQQSTAACLKLQTLCKDNNTALVRCVSMMALLSGVCVCDVQGL